MVLLVATPISSRASSPSHAAATAAIRPEDRPARPVSTVRFPGSAVKLRRTRLPGFGEISLIRATRLSIGRAPETARVGFFLSLSRMLTAHPESPDMFRPWKGSRQWSLPFLLPVAGSRTSGTVRESLRPRRRPGLSNSVELSSPSACSCRLQPAPQARRSGNLDQSCCGRVHEQRDFGVIADPPPLPCVPCSPLAPGGALAECPRNAIRP